MLTRIALPRPSLLSLVACQSHEHNTRAGRTVTSDGNTRGGRCSAACMAARPYTGPGEFKARAARGAYDSHARQ